MGRGAAATVEYGESPAYRDLKNSLGGNTFKEMAESAAKIKDARTNEMRMPLEREGDVKMPITSELGSALSRVLPAPRDRAVADALRQEDLTTVDSLLGLPQQYQKELLKTTGLETQELERVIACCHFIVAHRRNAPARATAAQPPAAPPKPLNPGRNVLKGVLCGFFGNPCSAPRAKRGPTNAEEHETSLRTSASKLVSTSLDPRRADDAFYYSHTPTQFIVNLPRPTM